MPDNRKKYADLQKEIKSLRLHVAELEGKKSRHKQIRGLQQKNELLYQILMKNINLGITLIDTEYRIVTTNTGQGKIFSKHHDEFVGKYCFREFEKRSAVCSHCPGTLAMATGRPAAAETEAVLDDGRHMAVRLQAFPVYETDGTLNGFVEVVEDISAHKQAEEKLKESEQRFETIFDNAADGILLADVETKKFYIGNKEICRMLGYKPEEIKNLTIWDIHPKEHLSFVSRDFEKRTRKEITAAGDIPVKRKDGSVFYVDINTFPITLGGRTYLTGIFRDVTERKRVEEKLRESERRFKAIFDNAADGILLTDVKTKKFYLGNKAICKMLGYKPEEIKNLTVSDITPKELSSYAIEQFGKIERGEGSLVGDGDVPVKRKDGSIFYAAISAFPITFGGKTYITGVLRDITKRKRVEEELRESEIKIRAIFDQTFQFIGLMNIDGTLIEANRAALEFSGIESSSVLNKPFWQGPWWTHSHELQEKLRQSVEKAARGEFIRFEATHVAKDGMLHYIDFSLKPVKDETGKVIFLIPEGRDITEHKKTEEKLRESEERYREIVEETPDVIYTLDAIGNVTSINKAGKATFGRKREEVIGRNFTEWIPKEERPAAVTTFKQILGGEKITDETILIDKDGNPRNVEYSSTPIMKAGKAVGTRGILRDVTEHKKAEEALRESEERFRSLAETTSDWIWEVDTNGIYTYVSPKVKDLLGYEPDEVIGKTPFDLMIPNEAKNVSEKFRAIVESRKPFTGLENTNLHKNGRCVVLETSGVPVFDQSGNLLGYRGIDRDVTERRKAEEELNVYREKMAQAERLASLGTLSATVAHELTQPLTVIRLSIENSLEDLEPTSCCKTVKDVLKDALNEIVNATSVVDRFRNYARQSSRKTLCKINVGAIADRIVLLLGKTAQRAKMTLHLKGVDKLPPVYSNEKDIEQLFFALTENAIQAADGKKSHRLTISGNVKRKNIELRFADNCSGIAPENLNKIFDPFFTTGSDDGRTGLGLPIVQRIVSGFGGKIRVQSRHGKGTTFYVTLPIHSETVE